MDKWLTKYGTPELRKLINLWGVGNNPELVRAVAKAGADLVEDRLVNGRPIQVRDARAQFPHLDLNP
jgi:hypothetical protein